MKKLKLTYSDDTLEFVTLSSYRKYDGTHVVKAEVIEEIEEIQCTKLNDEILFTTTFKEFERSYSYNRNIYIANLIRQHGEIKLKIK